MHESGSCPTKSAPTTILRNYVPFLFTSSNYSFTVTPDYNTRGWNTSTATASAADKTAIAAMKAQDDADWEAGQRPF
jgi:hypothetical protein